MFKIYSKLKKKKLLHIFFRFKKNSGIINLTPTNEFLQVSVMGFNEKKIINSHKHLQLKLNQSYNLLNSIAFLKPLLKDPVPLNIE